MMKLNQENRDLAIANTYLTATKIIVFFNAWENGVLTSKPMRA